MDDLAGQYPQWQYYMEYLHARAYAPQGEPERKGPLEQASPLLQDLLKRNYPDQPVPKYAVQALLPRLDKLGALGWELIQMQPVDVGSNGDIRVSGETTRYTHTYLCIFKRLQRSAQP